MLEFFRLLPLALADFALEQVYILGAKGYGPKRGRSMTHVEAVRTYKRRALLKIKAQLCILKFLVLFSEFRCFFFRFYHRVFFGIDTRVDFSEHFSPEFFRKYVHRNPSYVSPNVLAQGRPLAGVPWSGGLEGLAVGAALD